jgi:arylsulfatase A-like enzyme
VDRLAREGILFEQAFSTSSWTRPAMASLLTGLRPARHGVESRRASLGDAVTTLPEWLADAGYDSALVTANPQIGSFFGFARGFGATYELYGRRSAGPIRGTELIAPGDEVARQSLAWLEAARRPFALVVHVVDPHAPYSPPARFEPGPGATPRERYQGEVRAADAAFGQLVSRLERNGELERTLIVFTADHGEEFGEYGRTGHGASLVDEGIRIPLVLRLPGPAPREPARIARPVQLVDVVPTLLEAAGVDPPPALDGTSLLAPVRRERPVLASLVTPRGHVRAARAFPWKLVLGPQPGDHALFDLRRGERVPVDVALTQGAASAEAALARALGANERAAPTGSSLPGPPPPDLRAALEALGYAER